MLSIRLRLTIWYATVIALTVIALGCMVYFAAAWGVRKAADEELTSGLAGIDTFLHHKLDIKEMNNLGEELREHSSLMPRGKMFRVRDASGTLIYQPDAMVDIRDLATNSTEIRKGNQQIDGRTYRTIGRMAHVGPYDFTLQVAVDQTEYGELINRLALLLLFCLPVAACFAAALGYWMSGRVLAHIDKITATAKTIDATHLQRRLELSGNGDELDQLSGTINSMLDRIAASYDRISQFTADASHELRSPVAVVRSATELLLMDLSDTKRVRNGLEDILAESDFMTKLIADLLTLARNGLEENTGNMELFDLKNSVESIIPRARVFAQLKQIEFELCSAPTILPMYGSPPVVERVLTILLDNAFRYTPVGGKVTVTTWTLGELCGYTVRDTGPGIAPEHRSRIFERFYRVDAVRTHGDGSCGLGLAIARSLLDMHGGSIHLETEAGRGASFEVSFRRADFSNNRHEINESVELLSLSWPQ